MATRRMLTAPRITEKGMPGFLLWARRESPALYASLRRQFPEVQQFEVAANTVGMSGLLDSISGIAGKIGTFVKQNALPILAAGVPLLIAKKQADVAMAQIRVANAEQPPLQTALTTQGGYAVSVPVVPSIGTMIGKNLPSWPWVFGGLAALGLIIYLRRR